jgi:transposase-like protein
MYKSISKDIREQVLARVKEGKEKVSIIAEQHGISSKTVYGWLSNGVDGGNRDWLANNRLRKENLQLKQMIGELMLEKKREKKLK